MNLIEKKMIMRRKFHSYIVCDQLAMAAAIDPKCVAQQSSHYVTVELSGRNTRGQMVVDRSGHLGEQPNVFLIDSVDMDLFRSMMLWSLGDETNQYKPPLLS
jgi:purine nucleosidase